MASRSKEKEQARARRLAEEQARVEKAQRTRRFQMLGGVIVVALTVVAVAIAVSSGGSGAPSRRADRAANAATAGAACQAANALAACKGVSALLHGIPQAGNMLGNPRAEVTVTEFGDLECSVCDAFTVASNVNTSDGRPGTGYENSLIREYVRTGKVKLVYRALETATGQGTTPGIWAEQQAAIYDAGLQHKAWYYIELFYNEQQPEGTPYTPAFLNGIARQIPRINYPAWNANRQNRKLQEEVAADNSAGTAADSNNPNGVGTPTLLITGPKGQAPPIDGLPGSFSQLSTDIEQVS